MFDWLWDYLCGRKRDYQATFSSSAGKAVLADLAVFCRANETAFHSDPRMHAVAEGRREVWLRIQRHLTLTPEELVVLYRSASASKRTANERPEHSSA